MAIFIRIKSNCMMLIALAAIYLCSPQAWAQEAPSFPPLPENVDRVVGSNEAFGVAYQRPETDEVEVNFNFSEAVPTLFSFDSTIVQRDLKLTFITKHGTNASALNRTLVSINGVQRIATELYSSGTERSYEFILSRNFFSTGTNTIVFQPQNTSGDKPWGIRNISFEYLAPINLVVDQLDSNAYGYNLVPRRFTGLRANFVLADLGGDFALDVVGSDIDQGIENQVFLNGVSIGFLTSVPNSTNDGDTIVLPANTLVLGENELEFVQRYPGTDWNGTSFEDWAVSQLLIKTIFADLSADAIRVESTRLTPNKAINVEVDISNLGEIASESGKITFLLSADSDISLSDTVVGSQSIEAITSTQTITLTQELLLGREAGEMYLGACLEDIANDTVPENDCIVGPQLATITNIAPLLLLLTESP